MRGSADAGPIKLAVRAAATAAMAIFVEISFSSSISVL
jgi:hypothetical protein